MRRIWRELRPVLFGSLRRSVITIVVLIVALKLGWLAALALGIIHLSERLLVTIVGAIVPIALLLALLRVTMNQAIGKGFWK